MNRREAEEKVSLRAASGGNELGLKVSTELKNTACDKQHIKNRVCSVGRGLHAACSAAIVSKPF